jgi:hypothetical protein
MQRTVCAALLLLLGGVAQAEIDVRGSWQVNLDCGGLATATSFLNFDENLATGEVTPLDAACGTVTFAGSAVSVLESCEATDEPGQVTGTAFSLPGSGYATSDQTLVDPVWYFIGNCVIKRVVVTSQHNGTITDQSGGVATRIAGTLTNGSVQFYTPSNSLCFDLSGPFTYCSYEMLRNEVPTGSSVTVQPNPRVTVTFDTVTAAGTAGVTPINDPSGEIPPNFQLLGNVLPIFYDVTTTATVSGPITTCLRYDDANDDGIVDGTQLPETSLQLLHEEEEIFVDRTIGIDTAQNAICAETTSLSQLVPGAPSGSIPPPPPGSDEDKPVSGIKMLLKRTDDGVEKGVFITRDRLKIGNLTLTALSDPRIHGATLELFSAAEGTATFPMEAAGWTATPKGVLKYASLSGPIRKAVIKPLKGITVKTNDTGFPLAGPQGTVSVRVTVGNVRYCSRFGPTTIVRDEADRFSAKGALAAALLGCSDTAMGVGSPSGAFVD